jgi:hypothetical protein
MALTEIQRAICRLLAGHRLASGESYVAGGAALGALLGIERISRDVDLFHDTDEALEVTWLADRRLLETSGFEIEVLRERRSHVEAVVQRDGSAVVVEWARDSAFRFFPLVAHEDLGLVLHPFDLATNKVLALVGRVEARDWIDVMACDERVQSLGYLAWAACGKDPAFGPAAILEHAARTSRYSATEIGALAFSGPPPDAAELARRWHAMLDAGRAVVAALPGERAGTCVLTRSGTLFRGGSAEIGPALAQGDLHFHPGRIRGAFPIVGDL